MSLREHSCQQQTFFPRRDGEKNYNIPSHITHNIRRNIQQSQSIVAVQDEEIRLRLSPQYFAR